MAARPNSLWKLVAAIAGGTAIVSVSTGCRSLFEPLDQDGLPLLRRPTWWGFYRRALVYQKRREWQKAAENLETAIGRRPGAVLIDERDRERAKTYGVHFLDNYFPRRELGICYYHLGKLGLAEAELRASLEMTPSDRAREYVTRIENQQGDNQWRSGEEDAPNRHVALSGSGR